MPIKEAGIVYAPPRVARRDLESNGKLISDKSLQAITAALASGKLTLLEGNKGRISKKALKKAGIDTKYSIIVAPPNNPQQPYRIYAIYKGEKHNRHLGKGSFGKVKIAQDQSTGEFLAFKLLKGVDQSKPGAAQEQSLLDAELKSLQHVGQLAASLSYPTVTDTAKKRYGSEVMAVLMKLAPGVPFSNAPIEKLPVAQSLQMFTDLARNLDNLHRSGYVHRDIKAANVLYEQSSGKVTVIDYGTALQMREGKSTKDRLAGSPLFMEPAFRRIMIDFQIQNAEYGKIKKDKEEAVKKADELSNKIKQLEVNNGDANEIAKLKSQHEAAMSEVTRLEDIREKKYEVLKEKHQATTQVTYSAATDVYNLGMLIADVLDLKVGVVAKPGTLDCNHYEVQPNSALPNNKIKDEKLRKEIINFLLQMTNEKPEKRPSMQEVSKFFDRHRLLNRNTSGAEIKIGLLDINEFRQASAEDKRSLIAALKSNDKVQLICPASTIDNVQAQAIKKELEEYYQLSVMPSVIYGESPTTKLVAGIPELRESSPLKEKYSLVTQQALSEAQRAQMGKSITTVQVTSTQPVQQRQTKISSMPPVPHKVALEDLGQDGKLIPASVTEQIREMLSTGKLTPKSMSDEDMTSDSGRLTIKALKAAGINSNYSVIVKKQGNDYQLFAVYKGKDRALGAGAFGSVKLVQNLDSGEFHALKLQTGSLNSEASALVASGQRLIASIVYEPESETGKKRYAAKRGPALANGMITELATGAPLNSPEIKRLSVADQVKMFTQVGEQLKILHQRGYSHNDIKPDNILYDPRAKQPPRIIDWGTSVKIGDKDLPKGTPEFSAPEIRNPERAAIIYTGKTDVYSYAMMVGVCLGLAKDIDNHYEIASQQDREFLMNTTITDKSIRAELQILLQQATHSDPDKRPDMATLVQKLASIQHKLQAMETKKPEIGILDLAKFELCSTRDKKIMLDGLRKFETVRLIYPGAIFDPIKAQKLLREILSYDKIPGKPLLRIEYTIAHGDSAEKLCSAVIADTKTKNAAPTPDKSPSETRKRAKTMHDPVRSKPDDSHQTRTRSLSVSKEVKPESPPRMRR